MNTVKLNYALQYIDDDLLVEFFQMDDKVRAERAAAWRRSIRRFATAVCACFVLLATIVGTIFYKRLKNASLEMHTPSAVHESETFPVFLNEMEYQLFGDSPYTREYLHKNGFPADYGADTIGEKLGYLNMTVTGNRLCFTFAAEKTKYVLYSYANTKVDDFLILQSEDNYYLLIKEDTSN